MTGCHSLRVSLPFLKKMLWIQKCYKVKGIEPWSANSLITILINIVTYLTWFYFTCTPIIPSFIIFTSGATNNEPVTFAVGFAFVLCWIFARIEMLVKHGDFSFLDNPTIYPPKLVLLIAKCEPFFCPDVLNYRTILMKT